jgi:hypothetical protein
MNRHVRRNARLQLLQRMFQPAPYTLYMGQAMFAWCLMLSF